MMMMMILMRKRRRKKRKREMTRANERKSQRKVSRVLKKTLLPSLQCLEFQSDKSTSVTKSGKRAKKKKQKQKTGRQKLTSLPATDTRSLQNEKRKLVFVGPSPKDDDDGGLM